MSDTRPSDLDQAVECLAELVAWYGEEGSQDYCNRLVLARRLLKRIAPDVLRRELDAAKKANA